MAKGMERKIQTDIDIKRKAVKLVIVHLKKKLSRDFIGSANVSQWISDVEKLLAEPNFNIADYIVARKSLNEIIERIMDEEIRFKLRDSWYSMGKALDKKVKQN